MKRGLLALLRLSERPAPPPGAGPSLETFRASRRFLHYTVFRWSVKQAAALVGLVASLAFFGFLQFPFVEMWALDRVLEVLEKVRFRVGPLVLGGPKLFILFEVLAVVGFLAQLVVTGALLRLSWELRWYMVGEESIRIREGLLSVRESTMTLANIQNMTVRQGPLQRLFGIYDLEVRTAGGGAGSSDDGEPGSEKGLHIGRLRGLEDAAGLRDRIRMRLKRFAGAGLGDADDGEPTDAGVGSSGELAQAASELASEARALRRELSSAVGR